MRLLIDFVSVQKTSIHNQCCPKIGLMSHISLCFATCVLPLIVTQPRSSLMGIIMPRSSTLVILMAQICSTKLVCTRRTLERMGHSAPVCHQS